MNDIEVLEDYINRYDIQDLDNEGIEFKNALINIIHDLRYNKAQFESLLDENITLKERIKDLEEINEAHKKENGEIRERVNKQALLKDKIITVLKGE